MSAKANGTTETMELEWTIKPSVSPSGSSVVFQISHSKYGHAWIPLNPDEADEIGFALAKAASWCRQREMP